MARPLVLVLVLVLVLAGVALAAPALRFGSPALTAEEDALFQQFKTEYGKAYLDQTDEDFRRSVFVANLHKIRAHNALGLSYTLGMNEFGDMTPEEFHAKHTGFLGVRQRFLRSQNFAAVTGEDVPDAVDWTQKGAVTPVQNQGQCGSSWAYGATGSMEGVTAIATGVLTLLSVQQLVDCSTSEGNYGCNGGYMDSSFEYVIKNKGICSDHDYPYTAVDGTCQTSCSPVATISGYKDVQATESAMEEAVAGQPVAIAINASPYTFQMYSGGVYTADCDSQVDHGALVVGYGTLDGTPYWKVKNQWGTSWGLDGYILVERGKNQTGGQCGILSIASYAVA